VCSSDLASLVLPPSYSRPGSAQNLEALISTSIQNLIKLFDDHQRRFKLFEVSCQSIPQKSVLRLSLPRCVVRPKDDLGKQQQQQWQQQKQAMQVIFL
jgi:hypothetical protein